MKQEKRIEILQDLFSISEGHTKELTKNELLNLANKYSLGYKDVVTFYKKIKYAYNLAHKLLSGYEN